MKRIGAFQERLWNMNGLVRASGTHGD